MKAILEFNLPDDQYEFNQHIKGANCANAIWEMKEYLRSQYKYSDNEAAWPIQEELNEILERNDINLDNLVQ